MKDDQWVIGTGADQHTREYAERFFSYVEREYDLRGEIVRTEGFASPLIAGIYLGRGDLLLVGDAAGLVDMYRGLGMDNAALSARFAVKAIVASVESGQPAVEYYQRLMKGIVRQLQANEKKQAARYATNEKLEASLAPINMLKGGLLMTLANQVNRILPPEKIITLPF